MKPKPVLSAVSPSSPTNKAPRNGVIAAISTVFVQTCLLWVMLEYSGGMSASMTELSIREKMLHNSIAVKDSVLSVLDSSRHGFAYLSKYSKDIFFTREQGAEAGSNAEELYHVFGELPLTNFNDLRHRTPAEVRERTRRIFEELPTDGFDPAFKNPCWRVPGHVPHASHSLEPARSPAGKDKRMRMRDHHDHASDARGAPDEHEHVADWEQGYTKNGHHFVPHHDKPRKATTKPKSKSKPMPKGKGSRDAGRDGEGDGARVGRRLAAASPFSAAAAANGTDWGGGRRLGSVAEAPLVCLPYAHLIGMPKSGTTDLWNRLAKHPSVHMPYVHKSKRALKEVRWFTRGEFTDQYVTPDKLIGEGTSVHTYTDTFTSASQQIEADVDTGSGMSSSITIDGGPHTLWWPTQNADGSAMPGQVPVPQLLREMQPDAKFIITVTDPVRRTYSDYYFLDDNRKVRDPTRP